MQYETAAAAAKRLNITEKDLCELVANGTIRDALPHGKSWLIPMDFNPHTKFTKAKSQTYTSFLLIA